jgi:hypothetical protein
MYPPTSKIAPTSRSLRLLLSLALLARLLFGFEVDVGIIYQYQSFAHKLSNRQTVKELFVDRDVKRLNFAGFLNGANFV